MLQASFIKHLRATTEKAKQLPGRFVKLGAGQYFFYSIRLDRLYYLEHGSIGWSWTLNGSLPDTIYRTMAQAKEALLDEIQTQVAAK
jgi:hypothetical protein